MWILALIVVGGFIGYLIYSRPSAKEDYILSELKPGDRIRITYGFSDSVFTVTANFPEVRKIRIKHWLYGRMMRSYNDYNFNDHKHPCHK